MNPTSPSPTSLGPTSLTTVLCVDADPLLLEQLRGALAALADRCRLALATSGPAALAQVEALGAADPPLLILGTVPETAWLGDFCRRCPQGLVVAIAADPPAADPLPPERLYRWLPRPWAAEELRFTVAEALHRYRQERELSRLRCALAAAQRPSPAQPCDTLSASETQRRAILSAVPDIMAILTAEGQYLDIGFNQFAGERVTLGDNNADLIGASVTDAFSPEQAQRWLAAIERTLATGQLQVFEQQHQFGDRTQYEEVRLVPYQPGQVLAMVRDISSQKVAQRDRQRAEAALSASEAQLRQLAETLPGMVYRYRREADGSDRFTYISPGCADLFGVAPEAGLADPSAIWGRVHPDDVERLQGLVAASMADPTAVFQSEHRIITPAGVVKWVRAEAAQAPQQQAHRYEWHGFVRDITDRKRAELELRQNRDLREAIFNQSADALFVVDVETDLILDCNRRAVILFEAEDRCDLLNTQGNRLHCEPLDAAALEQARQAIATEGVWSAEIEYRTLKGHRFWGALAANPITVADRPRLLVRVTDITERRRIEAEARQSEQHRQLALELTNTGSWEFDLATGNARWSASHYRLMGLTPERHPSTYETWRQAVHPDDLATAEGAFAQALETRSPLDVEYRVVLPDGGERWVLTRGRGLYSDDGQPVKMTGVMMDISDRKVAQAALFEAEERLRLALELSDTAIWTWDLTSGRATWSAVAYRLLGLPPDSVQVSYDSWLAAVHPDDREATHQQVQRAIASGQAFSLEYRVRWPDGTERWLADRGQATHDAEGKPRRAAGVMYDITERKVAERERQQAELALQRLNNELEQRVQERTEALHRAQENLEIAVEAAQMGTWHLDLRQDRSAMRSLRHDQLFGYATPQREWSTAIARRHVVPEDQPVFDAAFAQAPDTGILDVEVRVQWPDQSIHWMAVRGRIYRDAEGTPCYGSGVNFDITDRKQAELALQESEARFRQITETIQEVFWMTDIDSSQIIYVSPAFETLWGIPREALYAGSFAVLIGSIHPDDLAQVQAALHPDRIHTYDQVYRIRRPDGELRWVHDRAFPLIDTDGQARRVVGVANDITDRKLAELALQESEARFRATFEQSALGLIEVTPTGQIVRVNQKFCDLTGYRTEELLAKTFIELTYPGDLALDLAHVEQLLAGRTATFTIEKRYLRSDGSPVWVSLAVSLIRDGLGSPQYLLGVVKEIGDRKRAEQALREQEQFLRSIYEGVNQPVCVSAVADDGSIRVLGLNPAAARLLGTTSDAVAGQTLEAAFGPAEAREILHRYRYCIATHQPLTFERAITIEGQTRWLLVTYNPIADASGRVYRIVGSMTDISDRKRAEDSLQRLNQDLERRVQERTRELQQALAIAEAASRAKTTFLANMSHELRTPLNAILGFTQLMARDPVLGSDHRQSLAIINRSGEHLLMLINDILEMAKIEAGQVSPRAVRFDLDALLHTLSDLFDLRARERGLALAIGRHPAAPRYLLLDEAKLRQVLINLLSNAIKFTAQGRVELWVAPAPPLAAPVPAGVTIPLTFRVVDTGIGIAATDVERLFQPFVQVSPPVGCQEGTGLGLAISRQFVQLLGGDIAVVSQPGQGTTFSFTLPVQVAAGADTAAIASAAPVVGLAPGQPNYRIVVADDDDTHRYLITRLLRSVGFAVREATNGEEAIDLWRSWQPHLIWLDMRMPRRNGYETAQHIRAQERAIACPPTKLLALTANAFDEDRAQALDGGCDDFVRKPVQLDELLAKMAVHLDLQYRYGAAAAPPHRPPLVADGEAIALLQTLPQPLLRQIHHCTLQLDSERLAELIAQLPADCAPLGDRLAHHLNDFAFDTIQGLLDRAFPEL